MNTIIIDEEFKSLLPKLDKETLKLLEENILENGCRDSLVLWNGILIDGHNRYAICTKHDIPFNTISKEFSSREDALIWIINTQVSRRNLSPTQLSYFRGLHYRADRKIVTNADGKNRRTEVDGQNVHQPKNQTTAGFLSELYKVNEKTIRRDSRGADAIDAIGKVSPEAKRMIIENEVKITKKELVEMSTLSKEEIAEIAARIEDGTYGKKRLDTQEDKGSSAPHTPLESKNHGASQAPAHPIDSALDGVRLLAAVISGISDSFTENLPKIRKVADRNKLKRELKSFIDMLTEIHSWI